MKQKVGISHDLLIIFLRYVTDCGIDIGQLRRKAGSEQITQKDTGPAPSEKNFLRLWSQALDLSRDSNFGLHFGEKIPDYTGGQLLFAIMLNSPSVGRALEKFFKYHRLLTDLIHPALQIDGDFAIFRWQSGRTGLSLERHQTEAAVALLVSISRRVAPHPPRIIRLSFQHPAPTDTSEYYRLFRIQPLFNQSANTLIIEKSFLEQVLWLADPDLLELLETHARGILQNYERSPEWTGRTAKALQQQICGELPTLAATARRLGTGARSLQIRLKSEGTSFRKLLDDIRRDIALEQMRKPGASLCEIALLCGFSEQSSFNHAFRRWTGYTPGTFRNRA